MVVLDIDGAGRVFGSGRLRVVALDDVSLRVSAGVPGELANIMKRHQESQSLTS